MLWESDYIKPGEELGANRPESKVAGGDLSGCISAILLLCDE